MLQGEGLVEARTNRGCASRRSARATSRSSTRSGRAGGPGAALAVPRMSQEHIARLEGSIAEMAHFAEQRDMRRWLVPHAEYHRQLTAARRRALRGPALPAVRPRRALPPAASRPRPERLGDRRPPRDPRRGQARATSKRPPRCSPSTSRGPPSRSPRSSSPATNCATLRQVLAEVGSEPPAPATSEPAGTAIHAPERKGSVGATCIHSECLCRLAATAHTPVPVLGSQLPGPAVRSDREGKRDEGTAEEAGRRSLALAPWWRSG